MDKTQITRKNHYVPIWYQKGFIVGTRNTLQYLDLNPNKIKLPNGRSFTAKELRLQSPKRCFQEKDLYTTWFGSRLNDEVEKFLFGEIDSSGATAVRAFVGIDQRAVHDNYQRLFEYIDAQKLRTPKGLDWIKSKYPNLTQNDLMLELQYLRRMHCTMWFECVHEIVSAENSDVKFIVTDHPVTAYNSAYSPLSPTRGHLEDPLISFMGTQTVFVLDAEHCLILTNLEYAKNPNGVDLLTSRTNARYSGRSLTRTDALIRSRVLTRDEVVSINYLLKRRSRKYIAAYEEAWLYPEETGVVSCEEISRILLPPSDKLGPFGGELFFEKKDGSMQYRDAFGRSDNSHEFLKKKVPRTAPSPNDLCGCGSGRKFKKCCFNVATQDRPPWETCSIRERNMMLCDAVEGILGLNKGKTWVDVRRELSNDQVKNIHEMIEMLWPRDTNIADLLPRPDPKVFRAVYMGLIDPRTIVFSVISSLVYFDEVVILNPFPNPVYMNPDYSPTQSPARHKSQLLKNVCVLRALKPFIEAGIVHLLPDPGEFNADFRRSMNSYVNSRNANRSRTQEEMRTTDALAEDDHERILSRLPKDSLRRIMRERQPGIDQEFLESIVENLKERLTKDPYALLQPIQAGKDNWELQVARSMSLELGLYYAHMTGSAVYTDDLYEWSLLHEHGRTIVDVGQLSRWAPLGEEFLFHRFRIETNPLINLEARNAGNLVCMRRVFRRVLNTIRSQTEDVDVDEKIQNLVSNLKYATAKADIEWDKCRMSMGFSSKLHRRIELSAPNKGFTMNSVHRLLIAFGRTPSRNSVPLALLLRLEETQDDNSSI